MSGLDAPVFAIANGDGWLCIEVGPDLHAIPTFVTEDDARRYLEHTAERNCRLPSLYRVVEYAATGKVLEG